MNKSDVLCKVLGKNMDFFVLGQSEILGRMAGPFLELPVLHLRVLPLGIVPKKEPNKLSTIYLFQGGYQLMTVLTQICEIIYTLFNAVVQWVRARGAINKGQH